MINNLFHSTRVRLTAFYLLIIMTISISFSAVIYKGVTGEFQNRLGAIEQRIHQRNIRNLPPGIRFILENDLNETRHEVFLLLLYTNGFILIFSGLAGYFLAGKTLKPIEEMLEDQARFVSDASHELKTPITALRAEIEVALRGKKLTSVQSIKLLKSNLEEVKKIQILSENLLSLSHKQSNTKINFEKTSIAKILNEAIKITDSSANKKIKIAKKISDLKLYGDHVALVELFTIIIDNAIKYSDDKGKVLVSSKSASNKIIVEISDNGIGITTSDIPNIFKRFWRSDSSRSKKTANGYGLGLSIAKSIVDIHKGTIKVKSAMGKGSKFTVTLPANSQN